VAGVVAADGGQNLLVGRFDQKVKGELSRTVNRPKVAAEAEARAVEDGSGKLH